MVTNEIHERIKAALKKAWEEESSFVPFDLVVRILEKELAVQFISDRYGLDEEIKRMIQDAVKDMQENSNHGN